MRGSLANHIRIRPRAEAISAWWPHQRAAVEKSLGGTGGAVTSKQSSRVSKSKPLPPPPGGLRLPQLPAYRHLRRCCVLLRTLGGVGLTMGNQLSSRAQPPVGSSPSGWSVTRDSRQPSTMATSPCGSRAHLKSAATMEKIPGSCPGQARQTWIPADYEGGQIPRTTEGGLRKLHHFSSKNGPGTPEAPNHSATLFGPPGLSVHQPNPTCPSVGWHLCQPRHNQRLRGLKTSLCVASGPRIRLAHRGYLESLPRQFGVTVLGGDFKRVSKPSPIVVLEK
ncbi:hypothetical protein Q5P01_014241 [Channa striata]|uniref:Uncharacterized protein n=1 Tax=Channa striata TaxID=64152 RepID=A0AA88MM31_CHASR|nr:hypothetical protein Q5P01_014241 [Channa striata]